MIEPLSGFPPNVLAFACGGQVSARDYEGVLIPAVEKALTHHEKLRLYYEIDPDFAGYDIAAVIDDFKVGMEHLFRWERIAVVTDVAWINHTVRAFSFLLPGRVRVFARKELSAARDWIEADF